MNKLFGLILFMSSLAANAQMEKSMLFVGGSISATSSKDDHGAQATKVSDITFAPRFGLTLSPAWAVGIGLSYSSGTTKYLTDGQPTITASKTNYYGVNPFVRYYIPLGPSVYFAFHGQLTYSKGILNQTIPSGGSLVTFDTDVSTSGASLSPMLLFFPSGKWGIELSVSSLNYAHHSETPGQQLSGAFTTDNLDYAIGQVTLGIAYYFKK